MDRDKTYSAIVSYGVKVTFVCAKSICSGPSNSETSVRHMDIRLSLSCVVGCCCLSSERV